MLGHIFFLISILKIFVGRVGQITHCFISPISNPLPDIKFEPGI